MRLQHFDPLNVLRLNHDRLTFHDDELVFSYDEIPNIQIKEEIKD